MSSADTPIYDAPNRLRRLERIIDGDPNEDAPGLRARVKSIEDVLKRYERMELMIKGAFIMSGIAGTAGAINVIEFLGRLLKVIP